MIRNCPNCGATVHGRICEYCNTEIEPPKKQPIKPKQKTNNLFTDKVDWTKPVAPLNERWYQLSRIEELQENGTGKVIIPKEYR